MQHPHNHMWFTETDVGCLNINSRGTTNTTSYYLGTGNWTSGIVPSHNWNETWVWDLNSEWNSWMGFSWYVSLPTSMLLLISLNICLRVVVFCSYEWTAHTHTHTHTHNEHTHTSLPTQTLISISKLFANRELNKSMISLVQFDQTQLASKRNSTSKQTYALNHSEKDQIKQYSDSHSIMPGTYGWYWMAPDSVSSWLASCLPTSGCSNERRTLVVYQYTSLWSKGDLR